MTTVGRSQIDPRIRQRRIAVQRASGRRRLRRLVVLTGVLVAVIAGVLLALSPVLDVDRVTVAGASATPASDIIAASGILDGDAMVRLDVDGATEALEVLPWVDRATIRRDYPSAVKIVIREREPVGILSSGDTEALVDGSGRVLGPVQPPYRELARVVIPTEIPAAGQTVDASTRATLDLVDAVAAGIEGHPVVITQDPAGETSLIVDDSIAVRIGDADRIATKVRSVATILDQVDLTCVATIDVRIADRPVLTRNEPCQ